MVGPDSQTDLFIGYQDKFFGLPGMYTGNESDYRETEDIQTRLILLSHFIEYGSESFLRRVFFIVVFLIILYSNGTTQHFIKLCMKL